MTPGRIRPRLANAGPRRPGDRLGDEMGGSRQLRAARGQSRLVTNTNRPVRREVGIGLRLL